MTESQGKSFSSNLYRNRWTFFSDNWIYKTENLGDPLNTSQSGHPGSHTPHLTSQLITDKTCHSAAALQPSHHRFTDSFAHDPIFRWEPHFSNATSVVLVTPFGTSFFKACFPLQPNPQDSRCHHHSPYLCPTALKNLPPQQPHSKRTAFSHWSNYRTAETHRGFTSR